MENELVPQHGDALHQELFMTLSSYEGSTTFLEAVKLMIDELRETRKALELAKEAVRENHEHHMEYGCDDGYVGCWLYDLNIEVLGEDYDKEDPAGN